MAPQPVAFSHKQHAGAGLSCNFCHSTAATKDRASCRPRPAVCPATHQAGRVARDQKLAAAHAANEAIKWVRVYRVPDFVFFSHSNHLKAGVECSTCHGPVETRDVLQKEVSTNMAACVSCHKAKQASIDCSLCHQLGQ